MLLLLLAIGMVFAYDQFGVYRSNSSLGRKALTLFKAWSLAYGLLLVVGFATKQTDAFSRLLLGQLYVAGYVLQLLLQYISRQVQTRIMLHAMPAENVLIVGTGKLARYLQQKVSGNPWLNQKVIGSLELPTDGTSGRSLDTGAHLFEASDFTPLHEPNVLGPLEEMLAVIDRHDVRTVYFAVPLGESHRIEDMYFELLDRHVAVHWVPDIFSVLLVNHTDSLLRAALDGAGITSVAVDMVAPYLTRGELVRVLAPWITGRLSMYAAVPTRKFMPQRTRVFLDFLIEETRLQTAKALQACATC